VLSELLVIIVVSADHGVKSLVNVKSLCIGETGTRGQGSHCHGGNADDTIIHVSSSNNSVLVLSDSASHTNCNCLCQLEL